MPFIGGMLVGLGLAWILAWLVYRWFLQSGTTSQGLSTAFRPRTPAENIELDRRGRADYQRAAMFLGKGVPVALLVVVAGIVIAII